MMAFAIATIVIMFCVIVALSIYIIRERKAHNQFEKSLLIEICRLEDEARADDMNANMHTNALSTDKANLQEQIDVLQNRCWLLVCELRMNIAGVIADSICDDKLSVEDWQAFDVVHGEFIQRLNRGYFHLLSEGLHGEDAWRTEMRLLEKGVEDELGI